MQVIFACAANDRKSAALPQGLDPCGNPYLAP
jgi:hypothetical protein